MFIATSLDPWLPDMTLPFYSTELNRAKNTNTGIGLVHGADDWRRLTAIKVSVHFQDFSTKFSIT